MSENLSNIARREFLRACATGGAGLALLQYLIKAALSCRADVRSPGDAREMENRLPEPHCELNPRYTFESFVIGASNELAHAACLAVSEAPFRTFNPLFIHGPAGLGKTHLLHAIGHRIRAKNCGERVLYVTAEQFSSEFRDPIEFRSQREFKKRYRHADALLIDDIQFLAGKQRSQEKFLHTFNGLFDCFRQIIISSDHPPDQLTNIAPRLIQRFQWGLTVELLPRT
jgi:chromosomal replication initiator protein